MPSTNWIAVAVFFAVGLLLLGISSAMLRSMREELPRRAAPWLRLVDESLTDIDVALRLEMIERLQLVDTDWSRSVLERARAEDPDEAVRSAAGA